MSAALLASLLLPSHAMPNRTPQVAHAENPGSSEGFESLIAGLAQQSAPSAETTAAAAAAPSHPAAATSTDPASPAPSQARISTNVDAALSALASLTYLTPQSGAAKSAQTEAVEAAVQESSLVAGKPLTTADSAPRRASGLASFLAPESGVSETTQKTSTAPPEARFNEKLTELASAVESPSLNGAVWPSVTNPSLATASANATLANLSSTNSHAAQVTPEVRSGSSSVSPTPGAAEGAISYATKSQLTFAPQLGFQSLQTKTHLAVSDVAGAALSGLQGQAAAAAPAATPRARSQAQGEPLVARKTAGAASAAPELANDETPVLSLTTNAVSSAPSSPQNQRAASRNADAAPAAAAPSEANATPAPQPTAPIATQAAASSTDAQANVVDLSDLGDRLIKEAQALVQPQARSDSPVASAPIKQLQLNLEPAHLGAVAVTLKLTNGKLSVDVGVANANTLAEVEGQRETIVSKLQTGAQPLESFVVHQQVFGDATAPSTSSNTSPSNSSGNASTNDSSSPEGRDRAPRQQRTPPTPSLVSPRNSQRADLVV